MPTTDTEKRSSGPTGRRRIVVVSPVFGGGFSIAHAAASALSELGHHVAFLDMRAFADAHRAAATAKTPEAQQAFFSHTHHHILTHAQSHQSDLLLAVALAPIRASLLQVLRGAGVTTVMWHVEHHQRFNAWRAVAAHYDLFLRIQDEPFSSALDAIGVRHHAYLPLASPVPGAPWIGTPAQRTPLAFFGSPYRNRIEQLSPLCALGLGLWGLGWSDVQGPLRRCVRSGDRYLDAEVQAQVYANADIVLNPHSAQPQEQTRDFLNPRLFWLAAHGHFQLTDARSLLERHFSAGEIVTYDSAQDLIDKARHYLERPEERARIAAAAQRRALVEHTYAHRMQTLLQWVTKAKESESHATAPLPHAQRQVHIEAGPR